MRVLIVTNMFPNMQDPNYGIFIKEQLDGLVEYYSVEYNVIFINGKHGIFNYFLSVFQVNWHMLVNRYDIIHIHYGLSGLFLIFNPFVSTPLVLTLHGTDIAKSKKPSLQVVISKLVAKRVDRVIVLNDYMEHTLSNIKHKLFRLPCGVDTQVFYPKFNKVKSNSKVLILFPGSPHRAVKNYPLFKEVTDLLKSKYDLPISEVVLENLTRQQVCELFNRVDCLLMTSLSEGSPQVIKEAMACNTPIVTTDVGNVRELLANVHNAKVVSSFDCFKLAKAVADILTNDKTRNGRENIFKLGLDKKTTSQKLYGLYNELQSLLPPKN